MLWKYEQHTKQQHGRSRLWRWSQRFFRYFLGPQTRNITPLFVSNNIIVTLLIITCTTCITYHLITPCVHAHTCMYYMLTKNHRSPLSFASHSCTSCLLSLLENLRGFFQFLAEQILFFGNLFLFLLSPTLDFFHATNTNHLGVVLVL